MSSTDLLDLENKNGADPSPPHKLKLVKTLLEKPPDIKMLPQSEALKRDLALFQYESDSSSTDSGHTHTSDSESSDDSDSVDIQKIKGLPKLRSVRKSRGSTVIEECPHRID
ncbi:unnamed protein product [Darwinula stevensoni]|uniref:Uncharacterized protein n=1 Tax=Darwinula stevensoni TaxID=69355 RepID=A0A7R8X3Z2_9CRUS|nr:unnamed protein product [Darwinula stevensoni]CAG0885504.1 unnamed protein product [Darwinula stevensoni]